MRINLEYATQIRQAAGIASESIEVKEPIALTDLLRQLTQSKNEAFGKLVYSDGGQWKAGTLVFVNNMAVNQEQTTKLQDGDTVSLMTLVSGG